MYYTETTLYLLWEGDKRYLRAPSPLPTIRTSVRSRSPSPPSSRSPSPEPNHPLNRQPRKYISYDSLKVLYSFDNSLGNWREVSKEYIVNSLNISHSIPYKILNIFIKDDQQIMFKVLVYQLQLANITTKLISNMKLSIPILNVSSIDKYFSDPNTASIRVDCSLSHISIFSLLGRDKLSFTITLNELDESTKKCFDAFRYICRSDKLLTELFEKSIIQYFDSSIENVGIIVRDFLDS
jgi:hypothetical protein